MSKFNSKHRYRIQIIRKVVSISKEFYMYKNTKEEVKKYIKNQFDKYGDDVLQVIVMRKANNKDEKNFKWIIIDYWTP